ncbi:natural resistance-associated macrophage protein [Mollisia scopiformis]|uniref:Natural resistance-associated macrophage protein n=1 Tax=Mollisia scopiformis TaxID=149040 RepID=A0A194WW69_MOLSC|nr:natural resistance-associated macrophage protein [Mollisia scopiformis]KUJ11827.1 natural resistance-associated macrophage protein [Mollisia scopiformis]
MSEVTYDEKAENVVVEYERQPRPRSTIRDVLNKQSFANVAAVIWKFGRFMGPGTIISVAYIDPDNFQTAISSGAEFKYKLLFMVLVSNVIAIFLQSLAVKLGTVTGMDLAQMNRAHLPSWLNIGLWIMGEAMIVCTDIGQVIGTAIAINILIPKIPLVAGCALAVVDTLFILFFYRPDGSLRALRGFELFVGAFVLAVFICFCIELSMITNTSARHVMDGFLPSREIFVSNGLYESCAILGGTLMPHTLYLGSGMAQARLRHFDIKNSHYREAMTTSRPQGIKLYRPSLSAIKSCLSYSIAELCVTLFIVAVFVNSAILIIAAASLDESAQDADLFGMYALFVQDISQAAGTMFALSLLFSGISAGIVATMAGQMIAEGAINWRIRPFYRRLLTRSVAIVPGIIIAAAEGRQGMAAALNGCNVVLSVALIFMTFPLLWYTGFSKYMMVETEVGESVITMSSDVEGSEVRPPAISMANGWVTSVVGWLIWVLIAAMNVASLAFLGMGIGGD